MRDSYTLMNVVLWTQRPLNTSQQLFFTYSLIVKWYIFKLVIYKLYVFYELTHFDRNLFYLFIFYM